MTDYLMDFLGLLPILLLIYGGDNPRITLSGIRKDYLSLETGKSIRGLCSVLIIFHHLSQKMNSDNSFSRFKGYGIFVVAVFFFLSGYGLMVSYLKKGDSYRKAFLFGRLPSILIPLLMIFPIYLIIGLLQGTYHSLSEILCTFINGHPIVANSWFLFSLLIFYLCFWLMMLLCGKKYGLMILGMISCYVLYSEICIILKLNQWWYISCPLLPVGMLWATFEDRILAAMKRIYWFLFAFLACLMCLQILKIRDLFVLISIPDSECKIILEEILFVLLILMIPMKLRIGNRVLDFLGSNSMEIYLCHGIFLNLCRTIPNDFLYALSVLILSIGFGSLFHSGTQLVLGKYRAWLKRIQQHPSTNAKSNRSK